MKLKNLLLGTALLVSAGLPAIPMAGLTAEEATRRLSADPDLRPFTLIKQCVVKEWNINAATFLL